MSTPEIDGYRFGHIVIDGQTYDQDLIILPDCLVTGWWRREGHSLCREDLDAVFSARPSALVVGQGAYSRMQVTSAVREALAAEGIELIALPTAEACRTYNRLRGERTVAAALHLTC